MILKLLNPPNHKIGEIQQLTFRREIMADYPSFSEEAVQAAIDASRNHYADQKLSLSENMYVDTGHQSTLAQCIKVTIENGKVCITLPLGIGKKCIPIPVSFDGDVAEVCLSICTTVFVPTGVKVTISVGGRIIVTKVFGVC